MPLCRGQADVLYYSIRSRPSGAPAPPLTGQSLELELPDQPYDDRLLGQIDSVESGEVQGWACLRGALTDPLKVSTGAAHVSRAGRAAGRHVQACGVPFGPWQPVSLLCCMLGNACVLCLPAGTQQVHQSPTGHCTGMLHLQG